MNRIVKKFSDLKKTKSKALVIFITAGDPSLKKTEELALAFEKEGVDLIELGVPFSDPLADGPVIQASSQRSLQRGTNLKKILQTVANIRKKSLIPLVLMSYLNPLWHHGLELFARQAKKAGVDGVIIPDLPPEEGAGIAGVLRRQGLSLVYLLAPTSSAQRQKSVARASSGFVYYVSLTGVTGARRELSKELSKQLRAVKKVSKLPVCVGFGVSTPRQAHSAASAADGVIVGSAVVRALNEQPRLSAQQAAQKIIRPFARALGKRSLRA